MATSIRTVRPTVSRIKQLEKLCLDRMLHGLFMKVAKLITRKPDGISYVKRQKL